MKITRKKLIKLIKEEVETLLKEEEFYRNVFGEKVPVPERPKLRPPGITQDDLIYKNYPPHEHSHPDYGKPKPGKHDPVDPRARTQQVAPKYTHKGTRIVPAPPPDNRPTRKVAPPGESKPASKRPHGPFDKKQGSVSDRYKPDPATEKGYKKAKKARINKAHATKIASGGQGW